tara:strand:- start:170 stop:394 length:225 start_codon:yes stop_codon:yes gene_type:complete
MKKCNINSVISKHRPIWESESNFEGWKITEIMHCKIGWCIDALAGSEEMDVQLDILLDLQLFIEDLQKLDAVND